MNKYMFYSVALIASIHNAQAETVINKNWQLVWSDEFQEPSINSKKWSFEKNCFGGGNNELQCYTDRKKNAFVRNGILHIVAQKEEFKGQGLQDDFPNYKVTDKDKTQPYTSARLRTLHKGDWKYGRMEARIKLPQGQGIWPAFWMLPSEWKYGGWPLSGEIDILEAINTNTPTQANKVYGTLHYGDKPPKNLHTGTDYSPVKSIWKEFHNYSIEWEAGEIRWYVDDIHYATQTSDGWYSGATDDAHAPFNQSFHIILNLAVGGEWPKNPDKSTQFPQEMLVDYVRVYQCSVNSETGKGCASFVDERIKPIQGVKKGEVSTQQVK